MMGSLKAVFLDKDGTLIPDIPYNVDPALIELYPDAPMALRLLQEKGYIFFIVSNQPGIAHGYFKEAALSAVWRRISQLLAAFHLNISGYYYCPHHPQGKEAAYSQHCQCRKPQAGLLFRAAKLNNIDLSQSWLIGDILNDVEAGHRAGCKAVLINNGNETEWLQGRFRKPDYIAGNLLEASRWITACAEQELS